MISKISNKIKKEMKSKKLKKIIGISALVIGISLAICAILYTAYIIMAITIIADPKGNAFAEKFEDMEYSETYLEENKDTFENMINLLDKTDISSINQCDGKYKYKQYYYDTEDYNNNVKKAKEIIKIMKKNDWESIEKKEESGCITYEIEIVSTINYYVSYTYGESECLVEDYYEKEDNGKVFYEKKVKLEDNWLFFIDTISSI